MKRNPPDVRRAAKTPGGRNWITRRGSLNRACSINLRIVSILCIAMQFKVQRCSKGPGTRVPGPWKYLAFSSRHGTDRGAATLIFWLCGIDRRAADHLAHLVGLLGERTHLALHDFAVQPHHLGKVLGMQQRLRIVEGSLHVLFG